MALDITFNLQEEDLDYFREVMRKALVGAEKLEESHILTKAGALAGEVKGNVPEFVRSRLAKLEILIAMVKDEEWAIPDMERRDVLGALAYFSDPQDLVPDHIPVLGFLDDAIMIELVVEELDGDMDPTKAANLRRIEARNKNRSSRASRTPRKCPMQLSDSLYSC